MKLTKPTDLYFPEYLGQPNSSIDVFDSSKMSDARACPRYYFFRHYLGWDSIYPNVDLVFGQAWHLAVEYIWKFGKDNVQVYVEAFTFAQEHLMKHFTLAQDLENHPKSMTGIKNGLFDLFDNRSIWSDCAYIDSEIWGDLFIQDGKAIRFRLDLIVFDHSLNKIMIVDHKTSKTTSWLYEKPFENSFQFKCYIFAGKSYFGNQQVGGAWVSKSSFLKTKVEHKKILILPNDEILHLWQVQALREYDRIMEEYEIFVTYDHPDNAIMRSFPQSDNSCIRYNKLCPYFDICTLTPNPLKIKSIPEQFTRRFWNPADVNI